MIKQIILSGIYAYRNEANLKQIKTFAISVNIKKEEIIYVE